MLNLNSDNNLKNFSQITISSTKIHRLDRIGDIEQTEIQLPTIYIKTKHGMTETIISDIEPGRNYFEAGIRFSGIILLQTPVKLNNQIYYEPLQVVLHPTKPGASPLIMIPFSSHFQIQTEQEGWFKGYEIQNLGLNTIPSIRCLKFN